MHTPWWSTPHYIWEFLKFFVPLCVSCVALGVVLHDRHHRLMLRSRKGDWYKVDYASLADGPGIMFRGVIEIYNASSRAISIHDYRHFVRVTDDDWREMISEHMTDDPDSVEKRVMNPTPLTIPPYTGMEANVMGLLAGPQVRDMQVLIEIVDIFGKRSSLKVDAKT